MVDAGGSGAELARLGGLSFGPGRLTPVVKRLLIANVSVFVLQQLAPSLFLSLALFPPDVAAGKVWQLATYMFLHAGAWHLLFNMLGIWMFGCEVEQRMGGKRFAVFFFLTGIGAGLCAQLVGWGGNAYLVGASGAVFGILVAFGMFSPYRPVTVFILLFPVTMQARYMAVFFGVFGFVFSGSNFLGNIAHVGGALVGWIFMKWASVAGRVQTFNRNSMDLRRTRMPTGSTGEREKLQDEVDTLLAKISKYGMSGLTEYERRRLYEASEKLKDL